MNTRGLPGTLAPRYHELLAIGSSVAAAASLTCSVQAAAASGFASMWWRPRSRMCAMQSAIHCACCSMATGMLVSTEGLPGPVMVNMLG